MAAQPNFQNQLTNIDNQIAQLVKLKQQIQDSSSRGFQQAQNNDSLWSKINDELINVDKFVLDAISKNNDYQTVNAKLNNIVQQELLVLVKDKVEAREDGKKLLEEQLNIIKNIKSGATKEQEEELLIFAKFKEYSKLHPDTTYEEFLTKLK